MHAPSGDPCTYSAPMPMRALSGPARSLKISGIARLRCHRHRRSSNKSRSRHRDCGILYVGGLNLAAFVIGHRQSGAVEFPCFVLPEAGAK